VCLGRGALRAQEHSPLLGDAAATVILSKVPTSPHLNLIEAIKRAWDWSSFVALNTMSLLGHKADTPRRLLFCPLNSVEMIGILGFFGK
jgi:hypothetical protein